MKKTLIALAIATIASTAMAADLIEAIVIRVGDRVITRTQFEKRLREGYAEIDATAARGEVTARKAEFRKNLVDDMISELLIKDRADRLGINITDAELKDAVNRLKAQYGITSDEQFIKSLAESGLTLADMEARLRDTLISNKVFGRELRNRQELTDRELRERYDREKNNFRLPERAHLREIVIIKPDSPGAVDAARQKANDAATRARAAGADFNKLAAELSESGSKDKGGDLGEIARGELLPELDKAVFNSPAGTVLGPIETRSGWHVLKVEQRLPSEVPAFESVKDRLRRDASDETFQRDLKAYLESLRKDAFIQIHEQNMS